MPTRPSRALLALLAIPLLAGLATPASSAQAAGRPNVVVILLDDARLDDLAYLPRIQRRLVARGAEFTRAYAASPLCCPARASLLTGQYAHNHGVLTNKAPYGGFAAFRDDQTLATWLDPHYSTAWIGKYLNGYTRLADASYVPPGWDRWAATAKRPWHYRRHVLNLDGTLTDFTGTYSTALVGRLSRAFIREAAPQEEPFFAVVNYLAPHGGRPRQSDDPLGMPNPAPHPGYRDTYTGPSPQDNPAFNADVSTKRPSVRDNPPLTDEEIAMVTEVNAQRRESLRSVDDQVAATLSTLRDLGELDQTYVVLLSDNGYVLGEHRVRSGKHLPYEPSNHIPLVIRGPDIPAGQVHGLAGIHDLAPTILTMAGLAGAQGDFVLDGRNLLDVALGGSGEPRTLVLEIGDLAGGYAYQGIVRDDGWKYVEFRTAGVDEVEMYDLANDPYELHNLAEAPQWQAQRAQLAADLQRLRFCQGSACG